jgi:starch synthase
MSAIDVLSDASEVFPLVKTGGLADVAGALPAALAPNGVAVRTLMPGYPAVMKALGSGTVVHRWPELFGGPATLVAGMGAQNHGGLDLLAIDAPHLYGRQGNPYLDITGKDWGDNALRFGALSYVAAEIGRGLVPSYAPDVVHAHDWQAGLVPAYLKFGPDGKRPPTVITIHNLAFQGQFPASLLEVLQLPQRAFTVDGVEYYGQIGFLKAGLVLADRITTVSPTYAIEIQGSEMGMGLDGLLRHRSSALSGILNGIDTAVWDPASDASLPSPYSARKLEARAANATAVRKKFGLNPSADMLLILIGRLTWQKGIDLVLRVIPRLVAEGAQIAVLGSGEAGLQAELVASATRHKGQVGVILGYDEALSHLMQGGGDAILIPSRFEPCGLTQLYGLRYGTVPIVARTGGLSDTIIDANDAALAAGVATGFQFTPVTVESLTATLGRALRCYRDPALWRDIQKRGMAADVGWQRPAAQYAALYRSLIARGNA